jgi:hypothetical protein
MSPITKTQILRVGRLALLSFVGVAGPYIAGLHGTITLASIQALAVVGGETAFRAVFPVIEADLAAPPAPAPVDPTPGISPIVKKLIAAHPADYPPPAVF